MEQVKIKKSERKLSFFFEEINKLEGQIMENTSLVMSEYISTVNEDKKE